MRNQRRQSNANSSPKMTEENSPGGRGDSAMKKIRDDFIMEFNESLKRSKRYE